VEARSVPAAVQAVEQVLRAAFERGASDVHLDPGPGAVAVTIRRDGVLERLADLPGDLATRLAGRLKALADLLAYRTDVPQEGRIPAARSGLGVEVRVATFPTLHGERVALRLDAPDGGPVSLEALGLADSVREALAAAITEPEGVVLLTGPSGSGKTTTLYACLRHLVTGPVPRSIVTVEDPVERAIAGVSQSEVDPAAGLDFARALRSLLRQDPDVILVGEIRDRETARTALEAGLTGHLVCSTIHAGTAAYVFARLLDLGAEPFVVTTAVRGVLAQRLLRRRRPDGPGYAGRVLVSEWLPMGPALRRAILDRGDGEALEAAAERSGHRSLREDAERLVAKGVTDREEVDRVLGTR
jgi:general secretion pathway protein E